MKLLKLSRSDAAIKVAQKEKEFALYAVDKGVLGGYDPRVKALQINVPLDFDSATLAAVIIHELTHMAAHRVYNSLRSVPDSPGFLKAFEEDKRILEETCFANCDPLSCRALPR